MNAQFLANSDRFFIFQSEVKGQHRIFVTDIVTKEVGLLKIQGVTTENLREGDFALMRVYEDTIIVNH